ncbi:peptidoglycan recognition protein 3-like [Macrosteles quadrilineatus]|uniref:peptidoglycan recognition protein 3-like n=1 Tax=Macrosteles quadrilineatus TaxID=74068 RepID=UPI0023E24AC0|nr:peptidoglycan recognition protein 3-like [Macrosteles quadrilineatus]
MGQEPDHSMEHAMGQEHTKSTPATGSTPWVESMPRAHPPPGARPTPLCTPATTLTTQDWGGIFIHERRNFKFPLKFVVLTLTTETEPCFNQEKCSRIVQDLQAKDMEDHGLLNIRYNFLLGGDGQIYEGRGWKAKPAITGTFAILHGKYLHIACIGDYRATKRPEAMYKAQWDLIQEGVDNMYLKEDFIFL